MATLSAMTGATRSITPEKLHALAASGTPVELIDVRTPAEFRAMHASIARSVPLESLDPRAAMSSRRHPGEPLYVICKSGRRGEQACAAFTAAGYGDEVVNVEGGTMGWAAAGLPLVKGRWMLPLDRQVQTTVGVTVLLACGLGAYVNAWWYLLAAYCGLGLLFAGVTGYCPLAALIALMPWNQVKLEEPPRCCG